MNHDLPDPAPSSPASSAAPEPERPVRQPRRLSLLSRISIFLARVPAFGYGLSFLALIPLYALIYFFFFPNDFYHSSVTREQQYFAEVEALTTQLQAAIVIDLQQTFDANVVPLANNEVFCLDRLRLDDFTIGDLGVARFEITAPISDAGATFDDTCPVASITSVAVLNLASDLGLDFPVFEDPEASEAATQEWLTVRLLSSASHAESRRLFSPPFRGPNVRLSEDGTRYQFAVSAPVARQIQIVLRASQGFPAGIPGGFARMLYMSASTATTTGYGDIVPITTRARFLTASEAILGLVIVGLFLNSVAQQRQSRPDHR